MKSNTLCKVIISVLLPIVLFAQTENWVYTYNGDGDEADQANSIIYGADGNIYAAGWNTRTSGVSGRDFAVISLKTTDGDTNWTYTYNGSGDGFDAANSIIYGADGNIYAAGHSKQISSLGSFDFTVISLDMLGDTNWTYVYLSPASSRDQANSIIYGADGNIYAAGKSKQIGTNVDFTVISLDTLGNNNWIYLRDDGFNSGLDIAYDIVYGADNNIYAAGCLDNQFTVISLDTLGNTNWTYIYDILAVTNLGSARSVIYCEDGNVYATGNDEFVGGNGDDLLVVSLTAATGDTNWTYRYTGPGSNIDRANSIIYGADDNLYVVGYSEDSPNDEDIVVICLDTFGNQNWVYRYNGTGDTREAAYSIAYDEVAGEVYVAGGPAALSSEDYFGVISLKTDGDTNWTYTYNEPGANGEGAYSIIQDADRNIYAAGTISDDFAVISFAPSRHDATTDSIDIPSSVPEGTELSPQAIVKNLGTTTESFLVTCLIEPGDYHRVKPVNDLPPNNDTLVKFPWPFIFESGSYTVTVYTQLDFDMDTSNDTLVKVIETYQSITEGNSDIPEAFSFSTPTISKGKSDIKLALPKATKVDLLVYDAIGRLSETLISERFSAGNHNVPINLNLPAGVYFYKLKTELTENIIRKFIILE